MKSVFAEREGFEPPVPEGTTVFKTAAFNHSAISLYGYLSELNKLQFNKFCIQLQFRN